jgi:multidrug transporter EmrE-like cation transporter
MSVSSFLLLLLSVALSAAAQLLLKVGATALGTARVDGGVANLVLSATTSPWIVSGFACYGLSAVVWLLVLARVDLSRAYPCVALGFALTALAGHFILGEPITAAKVVGTLVIVGGVLIVALA